MMTFGKRLKILRTLQNLTQQEVADKVDGISQTTISAWELDEALPSIHKLHLLSKALGVPDSHWYNPKVELTEHEQLLVDLLRSKRYDDAITLIGYIRGIGDLFNQSEKPEVE
jgi:transcriptional regulator with XRE-family HTH domain